MKSHSKYMVYISIALIVLSFPLLTMASEASEDGWTPIQLSIWNPAQLFSEHKDVYGLRVNIFYGKNETIRGFDFGGLVNNALDVKGIQLSGIANFNRGSMGGVQISGLTNINRGSINGIQIAPFANSSNKTIGLQIAGLTNIGEIHGLQIAFLNNILYISAREDIKFYDYDVVGVQLGFCNHAKKVTGLQIGVLNSAETLHGVQIGLFNFVNDSFGFPIINAKF